jgi:putative transposase
MGKVRNIFAVDVGRYVKEASERRLAFAAACVIWTEAAQQILCV